MKTWYRDVDKDGHGTPLLGSQDSCTQPPEEPTAKWVLEADDCHDGNKDVFPGQTAYFGAPYALPGAPANVSFDYDCDGKESPAAMTFEPACSGLAIGACSGTGYVPYTPSRTGTGIGPYCGSTHVVSCKVFALAFCGKGDEVAAAALGCR